MILLVMVLVDAKLAAITCSSTLSLCSYFIQSTTTILVSRRRNQKVYAIFFTVVIIQKTRIYTDGKQINEAYLHR